MNIDDVKEVVAGVGKDAPTVINEKGGKQSKVLYRFDLLAPEAMFEMTKVLKEGADKYGDDNWRNISVRDHLNHMLIHAYAYLAGDTSDDHLSHIMCRAMFAQAVDIDDNRIIESTDNERAAYESVSKMDIFETGAIFTYCFKCKEQAVLVENGIQSCLKCGSEHRVTKGDSSGPGYVLLNEPVSSHSRPLSVDIQDKPRS